MTTAQDLGDAIIGGARPVVDEAIDKAALLVLNAVLDWAAKAQDEYPGAPHDANDSSGTYAYHMGWDDALTALTAQVRSIRNRIQKARDAATN